MPPDRHASLFQEWLSQHGGTVYKVARSYTRTIEERQDLTQEILFQVWRSLPSFQGQAQASTWSYRVALNTALCWQRQERLRRSSRQTMFDFETLPAAEADSAAQLDGQETIERLYAAIQQLPKTDAALVLLYLDGLSYQEMAEILGLSESHVGVKLNRAKKQLTQLMKGESHEP